MTGPRRPSERKMNGVGPVNGRGLARTDGGESAAIGEGFGKKP